MEPNVKPTEIRQTSNGKQPWYSCKPSKTFQFSVKVNFDCIWQLLVICSVLIEKWLKTKLKKLCDLYIPHANKIKFSTANLVNKVTCRIAQCIIKFFLVWVISNFVRFYGTDCKIESKFNNPLLLTSFSIQFFLRFMSHRIDDFSRFPICNKFVNLINWIKFSFNLQVCNFLLQIEFCSCGNLNDKPSLEHIILIWRQIIKRIFIFF